MWSVCTSAGGWGVRSPECSLQWELPSLDPGLGAVLRVLAAALRASNTAGKGFFGADLSFEKAQMSRRGPCMLRGGLGQRQMMQA